MAGDGSAAGVDAAGAAAAAAASASDAVLLWLVCLMRLRLLVCSSLGHRATEADPPRCTASPRDPCPAACAAAAPLKTPTVADESPGHEENAQ